MNVLITLINNGTKVKEILMEISLDLDNIDSSLLFGEQFEEKLMEIISAKQKSIFTSFIAKETTLFFKVKQPALSIGPSTR